MVPFLHACGWDSGQKDPGKGYHNFLHSLPKIKKYQCHLCKCYSCTLCWDPCGMGPHLRSSIRCIHPRIRHHNLGDNISIYSASAVRIPPRSILISPYVPGLEDEVSKKSLEHFEPEWQANGWSSGQEIRALETQALKYSVCNKHTIASASA